MKKIIAVFLFLALMIPLSAEEEILLLPAWNTSPKKYVNRKILLQDILSAPPSGNIYTPAEYAQMEGIIIQVPTTMANLRTYYAEMIKGIIAAGAIPYIIADSNNTSAWQTRNDIKDITDTVLKPNGIDPMDVVFIDVKYNAHWTRDYGPYHIYVNGVRAIVNNEYYDDRPNDNAFNFRLSELWDEPLYSTGLTTEGGNFMTDGLGTCWTSTGTLSDNINYGGWTHAEVSAVYENYLNCYNGIYYPDPLPGEKTTHIDMFSKILDQNTIMVGYSSAELGAEPHEIDALDAAVDFYADTPKPDGGQWNIFRIPMTFATVNYGWGKTRVYYTHTNSTIVNDHVLVPTYARGTDEEALQIYRDLMPNHTIIGINSNAVITSGGAIHCTTMQVPVKNYSKCGNGVVDDDEDCDTYFFNGADCSTAGNFTGGKLRCTDDCRFDTSECYPDGENNDPPDEDTVDPVDDDDTGTDPVNPGNDDDPLYEPDDDNNINVDDDLPPDNENVVRRKSGGCSISIIETR